MPPANDSDDDKAQATLVVPTVFHGKSKRATVPFTLRSSHLIVPAFQTVQEWIRFYDQYQSVVPDRIATSARKYLEVIRRKMGDSKISDLFKTHLCEATRTVVCLALAKNEITKRDLQFQISAGKNAYKNKERNLPAVGPKLAQSLFFARQELQESGDLSNSSTDSSQEDPTDVRTYRKRKAGLLSSHPKPLKSRKALFRPNSDRSKLLEVLGAKSGVIKFTMDFTDKHGLDTPEDTKALSEAMANACRENKFHINRHSVTEALQARDMNQSLADRLGVFKKLNMLHVLDKTSSSNKMHYFTYDGVSEFLFAHLGISLLPKSGLPYEPTECQPSDLTLSERWTCLACTLLNESHDAACSLCRTPKKTVPPAQLSSAISPSSFSFTPTPSPQHTIAMNVPPMVLSPPMVSSLILSILSVCVSVFRWLFYVCMCVQDDEELAMEAQLVLMRKEKRRLEIKLLDQELEAMRRALTTSSSTSSSSSSSSSSYSSDSSSDSYRPYSTPKPAKPNSSLW